MNIDQHLISRFPYLAALYRHQSFTQAAASLFVSQTAMSYQIKKLENQLDCQLVTRQSGSRLRFTADGEALVKTYIACEKQLSMAIQGMNHKQQQGTLRISTPIDLGSMVMPRVISNIKKQAPKLKLELHSSDQIVSLESSQWDMAIGSQLTPVDAPLFSSPILMVASPLFDGAQAIGKLTDLEKHTVLLRQGSSNRSWHQLLGRAPAFPSTLTFGTTLGMREAAKENLGIALLPEFVIRNELLNGELVSLLQNSTLKSSVYFYLKKIDGIQMTSYDLIVREAFKQV